jgi:hypothetical protein
MEPRTLKIQVVMNSLFSPALCCPSRRKNIPRSSQVLLPNESRIDFAIKLSRKTILYPLSILIKETKILQDPTLRYAYHIRTSMQHTWARPTVGYMHTLRSSISARMALSLTSAYHRQQYENDITKRRVTLAHRPVSKSIFCPGSATTIILVIIVGTSKCMREKRESRNKKFHSPRDRVRERMHANLHPSDKNAMTAETGPVDK